MSRKVVDTFNNKVSDENLEYDLLITVMVQEGSGTWIVINELVSGQSVCFPPSESADDPNNECQQVFNREGVIGTTNYMIEKISDDPKIIEHIKGSEAFGFLRRYV